MQNQSFFKKIGRLLNVSSETFMLIALVSLFVMPIAIAKNLEPIVLSEESRQSAPKIVDYLDSEREPTLNTLVADSNLVKDKNVLGAFNYVGLDKMVTVNDVGLKVFTRVNQTLGVEAYTLALETNVRFQKTDLFTVKNTSQLEREYELNVKIVGNQKTSTNTVKNIYVNDKKYVVGVDEMPILLKIMPSEQFVIALESPRANPTNLVIELKMRSF